MEKPIFFELIDKYIAGKATAQEQSLLEEYYERLSEGASSSLTSEQEQALQQLMLQNIRLKMNEEISGTPVRHISYFTRYIAAAAVILVVLSIGTYFYLKPSRPTAAQLSAVKSDVAPGDSKAILTLSNGSQITLNNAQNGNLAQQGATTVHKAGNGLISYLMGDNINQQTETGDKTPEYNTITTPRGGEYKVILPDGTQVWLNAASSIRFPVVFSGNQRNVETTGEVYFEVTKDKHKPFTVTTGKQTITVLGTHFNVMAYPEEAHIVTTLLEGSVEITDGTNTKFLRPHQQAISGEDIIVTDANEDEAVNWKNGITSFSDADIKTIMRMVSRWYDVDVEYQGQPSGRLFTGSISRKSNLSELLRILTLTHIRFTLEGKRLIVKQ
ncbi:FecR family protein [Mucilaginibacter endophyticus]|uniref:FecR family protein n=1 Tax=Mucilaginibacter endophyticus TaxID=2675003 RepID=UPI000E0D219F|nr:FecR family protein [Mucilaginibacter endophyticus]